MYVNITIKKLPDNKSLRDNAEKHLGNAYVKNI